jgi:hypothetical protein
MACSHSAERREWERNREKRLKFFDEYDRSVPSDLCAFTQMTIQVVNDEEYLLTVYQKLRMRGALIGNHSRKKD